MTNTTTTNKAITTATTYRRHRAMAIIAAQERNQFTAAPLNGTPRVITLPPYMPSNTEAAPEVIRAAKVAAFLAIRARHQASGLDFLRILNAQQSADNQRENLPSIAADALEARAAHAIHRAAYDLYNAIANRTTVTADQRNHAAQLAEEHRAAANQHRATYDRLERVISTTSHSDRADIVQAAALAMWHTGNFGEACKAAGKAIGAVAAANGCTATRTKVRPITAEEAKAIREDYTTSTTKVYNENGEIIREDENTETERIPFNVREGLTAGYITIEHRDSKQFPKGWYEVKHYHTAAPCISYEVFASGEESAQLVTNGGINAITTQQAAADIAALIDRAKLNERERAIVQNMLDNTAAAAGARAVAAHMEETAERVKAAKDAKAAKRIQREADKQTEGIRSKAQRENAMHRAGIYSDTTQRKVLERIRAKLTAAKADPIEPTAAELAERDSREWAYMQSNRNRYSRTQYATKAAHIVPTLTIAANSHPNAKPTEYAAMRVELAQTVDPSTLHTVTEQERRSEEAQRAAHIAAHAADVALMDYRRQMRDHKPSRTAYAAHDAIAAAYVFFDRMSRAEQAAHVAALKAEEAAQAAQTAAQARAKADKATSPDNRHSARQAAEAAEAHAAKLAHIAAALAKAAKE